MFLVLRHDAHVVMADMLCDTAWVAGLQASNARQLVVEQGCMFKTNIGNHIAKESREICPTHARDKISSLAKVCLLSRTVTSDTHMRTLLRMHTCIDCKNWGLFAELLAPARSAHWMLHVV